MLRVEKSTGERWTAVAYSDRDEIYDETNNRTWTDVAGFLTRQRPVWEALFRQAGFEQVQRDTYLTACEACPQVALAVRWQRDDQPIGVWLRLRPYDATSDILPLLPVVNALHLSVETVMRLYPPSRISTFGLLPPAGDVPDNPLQVLYGDELRTTDEAARVGTSVEPWVAQIVPGTFTAPGAREAVALVGGTAVDANAPTTDDVYLRARLVVFRKEDGTWRVVAEAEGLAADARPETLPAAILQLTDFDRDGVQEILVVTASLMPGYLDGVYHLYRWDGQTLRRVWVTTALYDNTSLADQPDFATQIAWPQWMDVDDDGVEEIVLNVWRRTYARMATGVADTARIATETQSDVRFDWNGRGFLLLSP